MLNRLYTGWLLTALAVLFLAPGAGAQRGERERRRQPVIQPQPSVPLPPELARVFRDYEWAWQARDAAALAVLFTEDGMTLSSGRPLRRGRSAIQEGYAGSGGPLSLRALRLRDG